MAKNLQCSYRTIKSYVVDCKGIFQVALEEEILSKNPFVHIRVQNQDKESEDIEPFTPLEVARDTSICSSTS